MITWSMDTECFTFMHWLECEAVFIVAFALCLDHVYVCLSHTLRREIIHNSTGRASLAKHGTISLTNRPFPGSSHMVRNKLYWDANNAVGLPKQRELLPTSPARLSFVLKVPLRYLRPSEIYSVQCDRILQRAYSMFSTAIFAYLCSFMIRVVHRTFIFTLVFLRLFTPFDTFSPFIPPLAPLSSNALRRFIWSLKEFTFWLLPRCYFVLWIIWLLYRNQGIVADQGMDPWGGLHGAACPGFRRLSAGLPTVNLWGQQSYKSSFKASDL